MNDLGRSQGQARPDPLRFQRPAGRRDHHRRRPHPAALPTLKQLRDAGAKVVVMAHLGRPRVRSTRSTRSPRSPSGWASCSAPRSRWPPTSSARPPGRPSPALADGEIVAAGERPLRARRGVQGRRRARGARRQVRRVRRRLRLRRLRRRAPQAGLGLRRRQAAAERGRHLVAKEVEVLKKLTETPERPYVVVLGGAKVADKLGVIDNLLKVADTLIIGGGMGYTFLKAKGTRSALAAGRREDRDRASGYLEGGRGRRASRSCCRSTPSSPTRLPVRRRRSRGRSSPPTHPGRPDGPRHRPETAKAVRRRDQGREDGVLERPDGRVRDPAFAAGTKAVAQALAEVDASRSSVAATPPPPSAARLRRRRFGHISTGGGASLEYLEGKDAPRPRRPRGELMARIAPRSWRATGR
jgi:phosphoglycerate kinase